MKGYYEEKKENYDRMKLKIPTLLFIDGVAIYYDSLQQSKERYGLVDTDGKFVFEKVNGFGNRPFFLEDISIHSSGLFLGTNHLGEFLFDKVGNYIRKGGFQKFQIILWNREVLPPLDDFYIPLPELEQTSFMLTSTLGIWYKKAGNGYIEFGKAFNGLTYTVEYHNAVHSDREYQFEYVNDRHGNKMMLNFFWMCFEMANNGFSYLKACNNYIKLISACPQIDQVKKD